MKAIGLIALPLLLAGCATMGDARVLAQPDLDRIRAGMTRADTLRLLGTPFQTMRFPLSGLESIDYRYYDPWGYLALFSVSIGPQGTVVGTLTQRLNDGGDHAASK